MPGLANPLGLLALASVGVLIALTLLARRARSRPVASLLLWKRLPARRMERERFRPDLLFVLRLLLLLALAGGYVRPYLARPGGAAGGLAAVLDVSASMQVREAGGTRFDLARRRLDELVAALPPAAPVLLIAAADRPRIVLPWSDDRARLYERLAGLAPLDTPAALAPAVELAVAEAARRPGARAAVLTDLPPAASDVSPGTVAAADWTAIGRRGDNVAITRLDVDAPAFAEPAGVRVVATVRNFDAAPRGVTLAATIDGSEWVRHALDLPARETRRVALGAPPAAGIVRARLAGGDALAADDEAIAWVPEPAPLEVLLVTESDALAGAFGALMASVPGGRLEVVNRAGLRERAASGAAEGMVTVFDRLAPRDAHGAGGVLYVAPPPGNPVCPAARMLEDASVVDWESGHPLVAGLGGLAAVEAARAAQLLAPEWGTAVVTAASRRAAYPMLVAGEVDGRRRACLAAELPVPLATSDAMPLVLLTLSTLRWLGEPLLRTPIAVATGAPAAIPGGALDATPGVRAAGDPAVVVAERTGVHRLRAAAGGERVVLASLVNEVESDVGRDGGGEWLAAATPSAGGVADGRRELGWWFYAAAAALLALEWLAWGLAR